ncbi:hypothetical protein QNI19_08060 [Cytophagaceae bacterium DM2B3-1]|uniref:Uncharacterized protein n=1 Tax=Xanthocytophaga flava TaxID=3048013 RepID=A0ABT7CGM0_9BACT|nr:hypothetical protein [Xanthocytophaga flavus]MDJ1471133.1 hypothetical protein [Xanthocytophaga flavus]MDJ1492881.1 hypothetical protein [Xanthocytophaga flavus]
MYLDIRMGKDGHPQGDAPTLSGYPNQVCGKPGAHMGAPLHRIGLLQSFAYGNRAGASPAPTENTAKSLNQPTKTHERS